MDSTKDLILCLASPIRPIQVNPKQAISKKQKQKQKSNLNK